MIRTQVEMVTIPVKLDAAARVGSFQLIMLDLLLNHFQDLYDRIEEASKQKFEALLNEEGGVTVMQYNPMIRRLYLIGMFQVPTNVLGMLTRLRQVALHTGLVPSNYLEELQSSITNDSLDKPGALIKINPKLKVKLQAILAQAIEDSEVSGGISVCRRYLICQTACKPEHTQYGDLDPATRGAAAPAHRTNQRQDPYARLQRQADEERAGAKNCHYDTKTGSTRSKRKG